MPHFKLECSDNLVESLDVKALFARLHTLLAASGPFLLTEIKSRLIRHKEFLVADGAPNSAFVHLELAILEGRDPQIKKEVGTKLLEFLKTEFRQSHKQLACSFSVEIRDIAREFYVKETP